MSIAPDRRLIESIAQALGGGIPKTLWELYRGNQNRPWDELTDTVAYMESQGLVQGRGDGFVVRYALTSKGRDELVRDGSA